MQDPNERQPGRTVESAVSDTLSAEQQKVAQQAQMREMQARALFAQRREALAGIILNGICSGLYAQPPDQWVAGFGDRAVTDAVGLADRLMLQLSRPPGAANDG